MRNNNLFFTLLCVIFGFASVSYANENESGKQPNVILIMADDLGYECIGANGGTSYNTPVLDEMARTGIRFDHCYAQPICTPTRVKLMTGIYNVRNYEKFGYLPVNQTTFANTFRDNGYKTCIAGKWQLGTDWNLPAKFGFDNYCLWHFTRRAERFPNPGFDIDGKQVDFNNGEYGPDVASDYICQFIEKNQAEPFMVYYPMILTHCPFCPTPDSKDWDPTNKGSKTYKGDAKYFGDMVTYMDKTVGKILAKLDALNLRENTLVIFTGDNGTDSPVVSMMGDRKVIGSKGKTITWGTHVPCFASWPGVIKPGSTSKDLLTFTDFYPTICEAAGISIPGHLKDGISFMPQLKGETGTPREWVYTFYARDGGISGKEFIRNHRYKLYRSGKFFDCEKDIMEKNPLPYESLDGETKQFFDDFQTAFDSDFKGARPAAVGEVGEKLKRQKQAQKEAKAQKQKTNKAKKNQKKNKNEKQADQEGKE